MIVRAHRVSGIAILVFVTLHLAVHLTALAGVRAHVETLSIIQMLYRNPVVEPLLLVALTLQISIGIRFAFARWHSAQGERWARLQLVSGLYLALFIINHTGAALYARYAAGLDTNFFWASGSLLHPITRWFFYPYYALAIVAVFSHVAAAVWFRTRCVKTVGFTLFVSLVVAILILFAFGGWLYTISLPGPYRSYYESMASGITF